MRDEVSAAKVKIGWYVRGRQKIMVSLKFPSFRYAAVTGFLNKSKQLLISAEAIDDGRYNVLIRTEV